MDSTISSLSPTDKTIVRLLMEDGRLTHEQIAKEVHLSRPAVHERIKKLESTGVLKGYRDEVDWEAIGLPVSAFISIETTGHHHTVGKDICALRRQDVQVQECHVIIGRWCLLVHVRAASMAAL